MNKKYLYKLFENLIISIISIIFIFIPELLIANEQCSSQLHKLIHLENIAKKMNLNRDEFIIREQGRNIYIEIKDQNQKLVQIGEINFIVHDNGQALSITGIYSNPIQMGIGKALYEQLFLRYPNCKRLETQHLSFANKEELLKHFSEGKTLVEAIKNTPSYKLGAEFGFLEVDPIYEFGNYSFWSSKN